MDMYQMVIPRDLTEVGSALLHTNKFAYTLVYHQSEEGEIDALRWSEISD